MRAAPGRTPIAALARKRLMLLVRWTVALIAVAGWTGAAASAQQVGAVLTGGTGVLTKCFNSLLDRSCNTYHHIVLPERIKVGDMIPLTYGSNPKNYAFPVLGIGLDSAGCTIIGEQQGDPQHVDKLVVRPCHAAPPPPP
jgi:hypothetical protein